MSSSTLPMPGAPLVRIDPRTGELRARTYRVAVVGGPGTTPGIPLIGPLVVGSGQDAGLVLNDPTVSRNHARLEPRADGVLVTDLGSTNGTLVGGARVTQALIESEGTLALGSSRLHVSVTDDAVEQPAGPERFGDAVSQSPAMRRIFGLLSKVATTDAPVVLFGETGTGKDVLARALHASSRRAKKPLVVFDCSAVAANLLESELFGHAKGAFTGASSERAGAFRKADGGTIFLDEIGELPLDLQPRLLRVLETGMVKRVGEDDYRHVDVRVIAATHRDLDAAVQAGTFRQDLYFRLVVTRANIPPLRERLEDLPLLTRHFVHELGREDFTLPSELKERMTAYRWPGNLRELRNVVTRALLGEENVMAEGEANLAPGRGDAALELPFKEAKERLIDGFTRDYFEALLQRHGGNISAAARAAGIARPYLHRLAAKYGLGVSGAAGESDNPDEP